VNYAKLHLGGSTKGFERGIPNWPKGDPGLAHKWSDTGIDLGQFGQSRWLHYGALFHNMPWAKPGSLIWAKPGSLIWAKPGSLIWAKPTRYIWAMCGPDNGIDLGQVWQSCWLHYGALFHDMPWAKPGGLIWAKPTRHIWAMCGPDM